MNYIQSPFFSVIIPTYNREHFLKIAIESVLNQIFQDFELIVIDDGSTDCTKDLIKSYEDRRLKYICQKNHGVAHARNKGIENSVGRFIAFLDSDDSWVPEKLGIAKEYIDKFPEMKIFHTEETWYRRGKLLNQKKKHKKPNGNVFYNSLPLCCIGMSTSVIKKETFNKIGKFDESLPACEDYDFWLRATLEYEVKLIPKRLTIKNGGRSDQLSSQHSLDKYRIKALGKMLQSNSLNNKQYKATYYELVRKCKIFSLGSKKRGKFEEVETCNSLVERYSI